MDDTLGEGGFWLPSEFLTDDDDDILIDKENRNKNSFNTAHVPNFCFPTEFPYDCGSFGSSSALSSPGESVFGSAETESDEEDSLSGLTRSNLQQTQQTDKTWVFSGSPQSTLSPVRSWSGHGSRNGTSQRTPATPPLGRQNDAWDLIYAAAGQVSRLKINSDGPPRGGRVLLPNRPANHRSRPVEKPNTGFYANQHMGGHFQQVRHEQCSSIWGRRAKQVLISHHNQFQNPQFMSQNRGERVTGGFQFHQNPPPPPHGGSGMTAVFLGGAGVKKQCAGTGVFLPRGFGNTSDNSRKNPVGCSTALIPARVVQAQNKSFEDMTGQPQRQPQSRINGALTQDFDGLVAQRNAILAQQRQSIWPKGTINHEMVLPQEWTY